MLSGYSISTGFYKKIQRNSVAIINNLSTRSVFSGLKFVKKTFIGPWVATPPALRVQPGPFCQ